MNNKAIKRLIQLMDQANINTAELARRAGIHQPTAHRIVTGESKDPRLSNLDKLAGVFGLRWSDLDETTPTNVREIRADYNNTTPVKADHVPIISWVQAGNWHEVAEPGIDDIETIPCPASHSPKTYALRVVGDSMTSPYGRSYPEGCIIFVDASQAGGVVNGDRVIAKCNGDATVTFKQFIDDGGQRYLKPLNPQHLNITEPFRIIGKVIGMYMPD